ncbi:rhomboid-related intramembrane serine protease family protein [Artemisia annua]|uniref:Rhomboid-related intramembrane serine protease family protein n=1 Tax=Artemisia annua TaxID=35608 RepID=A0A2U1Q376_ARTAN|nr:rhomboid-related intramembrane serine protease family protein [Artemisia annua]
MSIATMQKLFSLSRICQNPRKIVSETLLSNPLCVGRATRHHHHTSRPQFEQPSQKCLTKIPLPFQRLLHNATYLKPKPSSNDQGYFRFQFRRYISNKNMFSFEQLFNYTESHVKRIAETHHVLIGLIVANVGVHLLWKVVDNKFMCQNFLLKLDDFKSGRFHTMITYAFSQIEGLELLTCASCLCLFGKGIGDKFGPKILLKLYLAGAFAGSTFFLAHKAFQALSSKNKGISERDPSKVAGRGAVAALKAVMMFRLIIFLREKIHNKFARATILGICIVLDEILEIETQKHREKNITLSMVFANMGGVAVGVIVGAPVIAGARLRKWRC